MRTWVDWWDWVVWMLVLMGFWVALVGAALYISGHLGHRPPKRPRTS